MGELAHGVVSEHTGRLMTCRPTLRAGRLFLATTATAWLAGCSSTSATSPRDAGADRTAPADAGDGATTRHDGGARDARGDSGADGNVDAPGAEAAAPNGDAKAPRESGPPDAAAVPDAAGDAAFDAHVDAHVDAYVDAPFDSGVDAGPPALRYIGRTLTDGTDPDSNGSCSAATPCYEWSGTQVVARFGGATEIDLTMSDYGSYFDVYVDGALLTGSPIIGLGTKSVYALATGLDPTKTHEVRLYKRTEASANGRTRILGVSFPNGGALLPPAPAATRRIEVIGDSISCGYGVLGVNGSCDEGNLPPYEDHDDTYGALTARGLGADLYTIASSGRGVSVNIDGTTTGTLPAIYGLALPYGASGLWTSAWDFSSWTPDAVVIDLGTNDFLFAGDPGQAFVTDYVAFVRRIRQDYPSAYILCTDGPMLAGTQYTQAQTYIQSVVSTVNDPKVAYLAFPTQLASNGEGCDNHPSATTHQLMATQLATALKAALGW